MLDTDNLLGKFLPSFIAVIGALSGVFLGGRLAARNEEQKRRADFIARKLGEFYGPMVSLREKIKARSQLGRHVLDTASGLYPNLVDRGATQEELDKYIGLIDDDNVRFQEDIFPLYCEMLRIFREKMYLAEPMTREYYSKFLHYVLIWERHLNDKLPGKIVKAIRHTEETVLPFYAHLETVLDRLQRQLSLTK